jgi:AraC-like DNA-binding protein
LNERSTSCAEPMSGLAEVALRAGFSDQSQFSFHFKRIVGITPGQFRLCPRTF